MAGVLRSLAPTAAAAADAYVPTLEPFTRSTTSHPPSRLGCVMYLFSALISPRAWIVCLPFVLDALCFCERYKSYNPCPSHLDGCMYSLYRTDALEGNGSWPARTPPR